MSFWLALQFLTVIPVPRVSQVTPAKIAGSLTWFPVVGFVIGLILGGVYYGLSYILPPLVVVPVVLLVEAALSGAHHLDGLIDTFDGITTNKTREERLALMAAPGVGAFGVTALCLLMLLKFGCLVYVISWATLIVMPVVSRWVVVWSIFGFRYARESGMGTPFKLGIRWFHVVSSTLLALAAAIALFALWGAIIMFLTGAFAYGLAWFFNRRFGGLTGDVYGALVEVAEVVFLVAVILLPVGV